MESNVRRRDPLKTALFVTAAAVVVGGLLLGFFGVGAELAQPKTIIVTVRNKGVDPTVAGQIKVGDRVYTDTAGMEIGRVIKVEGAPQPLAVPDENGTLHLHGDPLQWQVDTTIEARGRQGNGLVVLDNQVIQSGQFMNLISQRYYLSGSVVDVDVR